MASHGGDGQSELQLVLSCARSRLSESQRERIHSIASRNLDWARVLSLGIAHGVTPLLYAGLRELGSGAIPARVLANLETEYRCWVAGSLMLAAELVDVSAVLTLSGIRALAFKGPTLAAMAYGRFSLRSCRDLDILLEKEDLRRAVQLLEARGYRTEPAEISAETDKHCKLVHNQIGVAIELHWRIAKPSFSFTARFDNLWNRREAVSILDHPIDCPGAEDLLLLLAVHGATHGWASLKWICDIAELLEARPDIAWGSVLRRAGQMGCRRMLLLGLILARDLLNADLPPSVDSSLRNDHVVKSLAGAAVARLLSEDLPDDMETWLTHLKYRERLEDRLRVLLQLVREKLHPGERDYAWVRLPAFLHPIYYLLKPIRLFRKSWTGTLRPLVWRALRP